MTTNTIISVADYYGTPGARELVYRVKNNDVQAIATMARAMAAVVIERLAADSVLIPVPSHTGHATNTLQLAKRISKLSGLPVLDIVKGRARDPWYILKQKGVISVDTTNEYFSFRLIGNTAKHVPVLIDTVLDTGRTVNTISRLLEKSVITLTYAKVNYSKPLMQ